MDFLKWIVGILVICATTLVWMKRKWQCEGSSNSSDSATSSGFSVSKVNPRKVNESVYELHRPTGVPAMQVVFFHGLPFGDDSNVHLSTWESEDGSCYWPKTWLGEDFPDAHILVVSYNKCLGNDSKEGLDMHSLGENLISDLVQDQANIGQIPYCPVILVGHSFGGLVIKNICLQAHRNQNSKIYGAKFKRFLDGVRGIFNYSTPHHGSSDIGRAQDLVSNHLIQYFMTLNTEANRLKQEFDVLCGSHLKWLIEGLGESVPVPSGLFRGIIVVPEASAREGDTFNLQEGAHHFSICKPDRKTSRRFTALKELLVLITTNIKEEIKQRDEKALEESRPQNWQHLPEEMKGLDFQLDQVKAKLKNCKTLGFVGMGGLGKTTLAKAAFNNFGSTFEYTCFVHGVKLILGTEGELKKAVWKEIHCDGKKVGEKEEWYKLRGKKLLLVLDDIATTRETKVLLEIARDTSLESRFIITSRDRHVLKDLDNVYDVRMLDGNTSKELFMSHCFPNQVIPPAKLASNVETIVEKCGGLPLPLEVLGKYLKTIDNDKVWKQTLEALDKAEDVTDLDESLWAKLRPSYDGLKEKEQQMFLDAATFFSNHVKEQQSDMWTLQQALVAWSKAYETTSVWPLWQTLVNRSLVYKVKEDKKIQMHEQLMSMARKIASESNDKCRVWERTKALGLLQTPNEMDNKEYHSFQLVSTGAHDKVVKVASSALHRLKKVQFLELSKVIIDGPVASDTYPKRLVLLKCVGLKVFNPDLQRRLVMVDIDLGDELLPSSIGQLSDLRVLILSHDGRQETLPDTIGDLSKLEHLTLKTWTSLHHLPKSFGNLSALEHLHFSSCQKLETLPKSFGNLSALQHLTFKFCEKLETFPDSFGNLSALQDLNFRSCKKLETLPEPFGNLSELQHLNFRSCKKLETLPKSFGNLSALQRLDFHECQNLETFPESFGHLVRLQYLNIHKTLNAFDIGKLPDSIAELRALEDLVVSFVPVEGIPDYIKSMQSLMRLKLRGLPFVNALPSWLGDMGTAPLALSQKNFRRQDGQFILTREDSLKSGYKVEVVTQLVHQRAMKKIKVDDHEGAVADLCRIDLGVLDSIVRTLSDRQLHICASFKGFLLQERGIAKRFIGDLQGALEDLTAAMEAFSEGDYDLQGYTYDCLKHRGYVNFLRTDLEGAQSDGTLALRVLSSVNCRSEFSSSLGEEAIRYMHFRLPNTRTQQELMDSAHRQVMAKVKKEDFKAALAIWDDSNAKVSVFHNQVFFLQERGILKRFLADLHGALEDLTAALEILEDDYDCFKHRGYVKFLMGDLDGARMDAERSCVAMKRRKYHKFKKYLGELEVSFLKFNLK